MDLGLGLGQAGKDFPGQLPLPIAEPAGVDQLENVTQMAVGMFRLVLDRNLGRPKSVFLHLVGHKPAAGQSERSDGVLEPVQRHAGVDQGPESHIATDSAGTVKVSEFHGSGTQGVGRGGVDCNGLFNVHRTNILRHFAPTRYGAGGALLRFALSTLPTAQWEASRQAARLSLCVKTVPRFSASGSVIRAVAAAEAGQQGNRRRRHGEDQDQHQADARHFKFGHAAVQ